MGENFTLVLPRPQSLKRLPRLQTVLTNRKENLNNRKKDKSCKNYRARLTTQSAVGSKEVSVWNCQ